MYYGPKGETHRAVEPYRLIFRWSSWYVWGWCGERRDFRLFKLNRMTGLQTGGSFEKRPAPVPDLTPQRVFPEAVFVRARVLPQYKWRLVEEFGRDSFEELPDGALLFSFGFSDRNSVVSWIASFGGGAALLEPQELRKELVRFAEDIRRAHLDCEQTEA